MRRVAPFLVVLACGPGPVTGTTGTTGTADSSSGDSATTVPDPPTSAGTTALGPPLLCEGCELGNDECAWSIGNCDVPAPCGQLTADGSEATTCVLGLLRDRGHAKFSYCWQCNDAYESWEGEFYILGPERDGLDFECHRLDFAEDVAAAYHAIDPPEHFAGCLELEGQKPRLDCLIAGLHVGETAQCEWL